jgi:hypothetical protein
VGEAVLALNLDADAEHLSLIRHGDVKDEVNLPFPVQSKGPDLGLMVSLSQPRMSNTLATGTNPSRQRSHLPFCFKNQDAASC